MLTLDVYSVSIGVAMVRAGSEGWDSMEVTGVVPSGCIRKMHAPLRRGVVRLPSPIHCIINHVSSVPFQVVPPCNREDRQVTSCGGGIGFQSMRSISES
jgi:hypothetical protein